MALNNLRNRKPEYAKLRERQWVSSSDASETVSPSVFGKLRGTYKTLLLGRTCSEVSFIRSSRLLKTKFDL